MQNVGSDTQVAPATTTPMAVPPVAPVAPQSTPPQPNQPQQPEPTDQPSTASQNEPQGEQPQNEFPPEEQQPFFPNQMKPIPEELVYAWEAPDRPFKKRKKQFFLTAGTIAGLISLILFFSGQFPLIGVVIAVLFVVYMLYTFPPHTIVNQITTYGVRSMDSLYYWEELGQFWYETKMGQEVLCIEVGRFPNRLSLLLGEADKATITAILSEVLFQNRPPLTPVEKAAQWLQEKIPLDLDE